MLTSSNEPYVLSPQLQLQLQPQSQPQARQLSLNICPQYASPAAADDSAILYAFKSCGSPEVDEMLANDIKELAHETCNEHTRLLAGSSPFRNSSNNNEALRTNNNGDHSQAEYGEFADTVSQLHISVDRDNNDKQHSARQLAHKPKLGKLAQKSVGLKRVSFGSSKGSMVETLVFETPTPLSENIESNFCFGSEERNRTAVSYNALARETLDDSGIDIPEESERSIVRVSIYQSCQPQQIYAPEYCSRLEDNLESISILNYNLNDIMAASSTIAPYDRQQSTDSGWDNPFRPGGDLSREADEIVNMIRGGKPITPTEDHSMVNGKTQLDDNCNGTTKTAAEENITKSNIMQNQSAQNGTNSQKMPPTAKASDNNGVTSLAQVSKQVVPGPTSASHVVIDEKKNKKKGCCVVQ